MAIDMRFNMFMAIVAMKRNGTDVVLAWVLEEQQKIGIALR